MTKIDAITKATFEEIFTSEERNDIKGTLEVYDKVFVTYDNGRYHFSSMLICDSHYAPDHRMVGIIYAEDILGK